MSDVQSQRDETDRLVQAAAQVLSRVRYCWLLTGAEGGGCNARPMGRILPRHGEDAWTIHFVADARSRKAREIRHCSRSELIFQDEAAEAFVVLSGNATVLTSSAAIGRLWKDAYEVYFPREEDRANATFVEVEVRQMRLWIRGVTPEPFGISPTVIERDGHDEWRPAEA